MFVERVFTANECVFPTPRVIDYLIRQDQRTRVQVLLDATHCVDRNYLADTQVMQCPDIRAVIDEMRGNCMLPAMTRKKPDGAGWRCFLINRYRFGCERCLYLHSLTEAGVDQVVKTATA